jgi:PhzF family phenazine biosynthesis protein
MTPTVEVPLCGHATLASAHVLFGELGERGERLAFDTLSGPLTVARAVRGYEMDLPAMPPRRIATPAGLAEAIGAPILETWAARYLVAIIDGEAALRALHPNLARIADIGVEAGADPGNLAVAAWPEAGADFDVVSRFFAPGSGIPEDPATGSAYCMLGPLFAEKLGRKELRFHQAYPGRGADIAVEVRGDRTQLRGEAVTVIESRLRL